MNHHFQLKAVAHAVGTVWGFHVPDPATFQIFDFLERGVVYVPA